MQSDPRRKGFLDIVLFSWANNVWFGIATLATIFVYSSLGSAIPPLRQHPWFDMTEMEWFNWWPFQLMIALMCTTMVVVTFKQIRLRWDNAGVLTIHTGIIVLSLGSVYYFGTKLEGDVPVFRRRAVIKIPGHPEPASLLIRPDNHITVETEGGTYRFTVSQVFPKWQLASGADEGKTAYMAWIDVVTPEQSFTRQLLAGFPQYTEDILPDRTRAKKTLGKPLVDESLLMTLDYEAQTEFFVMDTAALYVRYTTSHEWIERPIENPPHYNDHIGSPDDVFVAAGQQPPPSRPLDINVPAIEPDDPLADYDVRVTGYLRYAFPASSWRDGGDQLNPVVRMSLHAGPQAETEYELIAFDPKRNKAEEGQIAFRWVRDADVVEQMIRSPQGRLIFHVPASGVTRDIPIDSMPRASIGQDFQPIEGTPYSFRLRSVVNNLGRRKADADGASMSVAIVEIKTPDRTITRFVADLPGASRDSAENGDMVEPDPAIEIEHVPGIGARVLIVAGPPGVQTQVLVESRDGDIERHTINPGESVTLTTGVSLTLDRLITHATEDRRPRIVPRARRNRDARESYSMVRVDIRKNDWSESLWLEFNRYAFPSQQYAIPGRFGYNPTRLHLPDGRHVELMYSRERHPLPAPIALENFELATHTGGYTGQTISVRDFVSQLRFKTDNVWSEPVQMSSNLPATEGGFWYFQSTWDPPGRGYGGMNYTGLGVGNRNGVYIQLAGTCIAVTGMLFAFYVKPIIRRRQMVARKGASAETENARVDVTAKSEVQQPVGTS